MNLAQLDYSFPPELIALHPPQKRGTSRMMRLGRSSGEISHHTFADFPSFFKKGDLLVINDSKVFPARLLTTKKTGGKIEILLVRETEPSLWECLITGKVSAGAKLIFSEKLSGVILGEPGEPRQIKLAHNGPLVPILDEIGHMPLPPYILSGRTKISPSLSAEGLRRGLGGGWSDCERYQTVYAEKTGSVAAPTAGLHFTEKILQELKNRGVILAPITLHVGPGTFLPIRTENLTDHHMHREYYEIPDATAIVIQKAKKEGRPVSVVGTTAVRALESSLGQAGKGSTEKFIYPPYEFAIVDRLLTNFHQPKSSLLALVSAFSDTENIRRAYQTAIHEKYRFFSYGDCLWIS